MGDYDCRTQGHHWIDHPEDGRFCFYCDEKYDFVQLYNRIKQLEAALRDIAYGPHDADASYAILFGTITTKAIKALEGKDD